MDSGSFLNSYNDLIDKFKTIWELDIENIRATFFEAVPEKSKVAFANNIVLYGALPALAKHHNLDKIRLFKKQQTVTVNGESEEIFQATSPCKEEYDLFLYECMNDIKNRGKDPLKNIIEKCFSEFSLLFGIFKKYNK